MRSEAGEREKKEGYRLKEGELRDKAGERDVGGQPASCDRGR